MKISLVISIIIIASVILGIGAFFGFDLSGRVTEGSCSPRYECDDWSSCVDGIQSRICKDVKCNSEKIIERKLCNQNCKPDIKCDDWSGCIYLEEFDDIAKNEISFLGYRERVCSDVNGCMVGFNEFEECKDSYYVKFSLKEVCGKNYVIGVDDLGKAVTFIEANIWKDSNKLIISFDQSERKYCPSCYNGLRDSDEEGVDCGGNCKVCVKEQGGTFNFIYMGVWGIFIISFISFLVLFSYEMRRR